MWDTKATFFWWRGHGQAPWSTAIVLTACIQMAEGVLNVIAVVSLSRACIGTIAVAKEIVRGGAFDGERAGNLLSACVSPFLMVFFVVAVFKFVASDIGFVDEGALLFGIK